MARETLVNFIARKFSSYQGLDGMMETLRSKIEMLSCRADDINEELENAKLQSRKKRKREVENWLADVERKRNKFQSIEQEVQERSIASVLFLKNRIDTLIGEVTELSEQGCFPGGLLLDVHETGGEPLLAPKLIGQRFKQNLEKIWTILMDDEVLRIGIYGMGGVGKTTLVSLIYNRLLKTSDPVYWITVTQDCSTHKLQNEIAKNLNLRFSNEDDERKRAAELSEVFRRGKKCVFVLDDVWNKIPLDTIGITKGVNGCKLILTTRKLDVCLGMECQEKIKVKPLFEEEAWNLFSEKLGQHTALSPQVRDIAMSVAAKCDGLPLGIITIAASMRGVNDIRVWRNMLEELKELTMGQEDMEIEVFPILKFSYSRLNDMKLQHCFLHCAMYPEDYKIKRDELLGHFISEGLIDERKSWQAKFDKGHTMLNKLEKACLLESCKHTDTGERCVKMHDLIREMALKITKESHPRFKVKARVGLRKIPDKQEWTEDLEKVSLMENEIEEISRISPRCPRLSTLILKRNPLVRIADSFFEHMHALKVLNLSDSLIVKLPNSISDLENLTALLLGWCQSLTYVPSLGKLSVLQELDLSYTAIKEIPQGVDRLVHLKTLNMECTRNLEMIPSGALGRLSLLQCLRLYCVSGPVDVQAGELEGLTELEEFEVWLNDVHGFNRLVKSLQQRCGMLLNKYFLELSEPSNGHKTLHKYRKAVKLQGAIIKRGGEGEDGILLPYDLEFLDIEECSFASSSCLCDVFPSLSSNARDLKQCMIWRCEGLESILSVSSSGTEEAAVDVYQGESCCCVPFQSLETLHLSELPNFRALFRRSRKWELPLGTFSNLKLLYIADCPQINKLFTPRLLLQHLRNLKEITVEGCDQMKEIIVTELDDDEDKGMGTSYNDDADNHNARFPLPNLKKLCLHGLPELRSICEGIMVCDSIEVIEIRKCPKLKRLPFSLPFVNGQFSAPTTLKKIKVDKDLGWWESLEWDEPNAKNVLQPFLCFYKVHLSCKSLAELGDGL